MFGTGSRCELNAPQVWSTQSSVSASIHLCRQLAPQVAVETDDLLIIGFSSPGLT